MKNLIHKIVTVLIAVFMFLGIANIFIGIGFADSESLLPTVLCIGSGMATIGLCYVFGKAVFECE